MYRVLRNITRNEKGNYVDPDLEKNAPLQFALLSNIMKNQGFSDVAIQDLVYQLFHCDPYAHAAVLEEAANCCHVLMTWDGGHNFAVSSSHLIRDLDMRFHSWKSSSGGNRRAAVKVEADDLDDVLLIPRQGKTPFQAIPQCFVGGNTTGASPETIFPIHAGSPSDTVDVGKHWLSSQKYGQLIQDRYRAFRKPNGPGTAKSSCFVGNFHGTPEDAEAIVESAAAAVLKALKGCNKKASSNSPVLVHKRDLVVVKEMYDRGEVNNLGHLPNDFWTEARKVAHGKKSVKGGACERGRMEEGSAKDAFVVKIKAKDGCTLGRMAEGSPKKKHVALCVAKGGIPKGPMAGTELEDHRAKIDEGFKKSSELLFRLANGKKDQVHKWTVTSRYYTTTCLHTFNNGFDDPIKGIGKFEDHLLKSYLSEDLTEDGKSALAEMKKKRIAREKKGQNLSVRSNVRTRMSQSFRLHLNDVLYCNFHKIIIRYI